MSFHAGISIPSYIINSRQVAVSKATKITKEQKSEPKASIIQAKNMELAHALELASILHTTLDIEKLLELFSTETQKSVTHESVHFQNKDLDLQITHGTKGNVSCSYRLLIAGQKLGEITFTTNEERFTEKDTKQLEFLIPSLLHPLRNALMYYQALITALKDPLTGVNNRTSFEATLQREVDIANRHNTPLALMVIDIDHFKKVNDNHGHLVGDCVLRDVAHCTSKCIRSTDIIFRYGGEEFVVLLNNTTPEGAKLLAERIRLSIGKRERTYGKISVKTTVSLGVARLEKDEDGISLFRRADEAMYKAKEQGRNRTVSAA